MTTRERGPISTWSGLLLAGALGGLVLGAGCKKKEEDDDPPVIPLPAAAPTLPPAPTDPVPPPPTTTVPPPATTTPPPTQPQTQPQYPTQPTPSAPAPTPSGSAAPSSTQPSGQLPPFQIPSTLPSTLPSNLPPLPSGFPKFPASSERRRPDVSSGDQPPGRVAFAAYGLDRRSERRDRPRALEDALSHPAARLVLVCGDAVVGARDATGLRPSVDRVEARALGADEALAVLLGFADDDAPWIAAPAATTPAAAAAAGLELVGLRALLLEPQIAPGLLGVVAEARSLIDWHARQRFCGACAAPTRSTAAGHRRDCTSCSGHQFPRVDPVAIMLVIDGDRCLLGRQPRFPPRMYTCLAGFIEPGETMEDAVRREVREESGVRVDGVAYHASQPWPFPSSLMLGAYAEAASTAVTVNPTELEDCRWFPRDEVAQMAAGAHDGGLTLPIGGTLSRRLIDDWLAPRTASSPFDR